MKVKYFIILFIFGNILLADEYNNNSVKQVTIQSQTEEDENLYRSRKGKKGKKRRRGGHGLR